MSCWKQGMIAVLACLLSVCIGQAAEPRLYGPEPVDFYISTGDNLWLGNSLSLDTPQAIDAMFDLLKDSGVRRVYWRGLEQKLMNGNPLRPQNLRYASWARWTRDLYQRFDPDKAAIAAAHKRGMEIWAVGKLNEFGGQADAVPTNSWPFFEGSPLIEKYPVLDRYGVLHQGGTVDFSTPEARQEVIDMVMGVLDEYHYDGVMFLTYAENHSQRFADEYGFNPPIAEEFKKRFGIDPRFEDFTRAASREDWVRLRGEYLSEYLRGMKGRLAKNGQKLGLFVNPWAPHDMQPWNVPEMIQTAGPIHIDLEGLLADGTLDQMNVFGGFASSNSIMAKAAERLLWMVRQTKAGVSIDTSEMVLPIWMPLRNAGAAITYDTRSAPVYLNRGGFPNATLADLKSPQSFKRMRALQQIAYKQLHGTTQDVIPFANDPNPIARSLAIFALDRLGDPAAFSIIEKALDDPELVVRCFAIRAMTHAPGPQDQIVEKILASVAGMPVHPVVEEALEVLIGINPRPDKQLAQAMLADTRPRVAEVSARALESMAHKDLLDGFLAGLKSNDEYIRYACTKGLGHLHDSPQAVEALLTQLEKPGDVVVNNRAAIALEEIIGENQPGVASLRPRMLEAITKAYQAYGDGCTRADAEWGYRPVGNALLAFGKTGEDVLRQFMLQRQDVRLAELAWKSLCIPHHLSRFDFVTEAENRRAFAQRPPSLHKYEVVRVGQNFDAAGPGDAQAQGTAGETWSGFDAAGSHLDDHQAHSGKVSAQLVRGQPAGNIVTVELSHAVRDGANAKLTLWLYRDSDQSAFGANAAGSGGRGMGFFINPDGILHLWDGHESRWVITDVKIPSRQWVQLSLLSDNPRQRYSATITDAGGKAQSANIEGILTTNTEITRLQFSPQGEQDTSSHVDDVELIGMP